MSSSYLNWNGLIIIAYSLVAYIGFIFVIIAAVVYKLFL